MGRHCIRFISSALSLMLFILSFTMRIGADDEKDGDINGSVKQAIEVNRKTIDANSAEQEFLIENFSKDFTAEESISAYNFLHSDGTRSSYMFEEDGTLYEVSSSPETRDSATVYLSDYSIDINEGETYQLYATAVPFGQTSQVSWFSGNSSIATVNSSTGVVTAVAANKSATYIYAAVTYQGQMYFSSCTVYVKIPDGTYRIKNKSSGLLADATGYSSGSEVLQWYSHSGSNQRWAIEYISDGVYSVKNWMSGLYLGVESLNSTTAKTVQCSSLNNQSEWRISKTASGAYCMYAVGNVSYSLVIGSAAAGNTAGTAIKNMIYTSNTDYKDEWILDRIKYDITSYYDSSLVGSSALISNIPEAVSFANFVFNKLCGLSFDNLSCSRKYDILCDQCSTGIDVECDDDLCGENCINHHKNVHSISNQLLYQLPDDTIACLWTNREDGTYCFEDNLGNHTLVADSIYGLVYDERPVIHFLQIDTNNNHALACMAINLVHEITHTFGMPDVYNNSNHALLNYYTCVMQKYRGNNNEVVDFYNDISSGEDYAFCSECEMGVTFYILQTLFG